jgi:hypothetical protein
MSKCALWPGLVVEETGSEKGHWIPLVLMLSQISPVYTLPFYFLEVHFNIILLFTHGSSKRSLYSGLTPKYCMHKAGTLQVT